MIARGGAVCPCLVVLGSVSFLGCLCWKQGAGGDQSLVYVNKERCLTSSVLHSLE